MSYNRTLTLHNSKCSFYAWVSFLRIKLDSAVGETGIVYAYDQISRMRTTYELNMWHSSYWNYWFSTNCCSYEGLLNLNWNIYTSKPHRKKERFRVSLGLEVSFFNHFFSLNELTDLTEKYSITITNKILNCSIEMNVISSFHSFKMAAIIFSLHTHTAIFCSHHLSQAFYLK